MILAVLFWVFAVIGIVASFAPLSPPYARLPWVCMWIDVVLLGYRVYGGAL